MAATRKSTTKQSAKSGKPKGKPTAKKAKGAQSALQTAIKKAKGKAAKASSKPGKSTASKSSKDGAAGPSAARKRARADSDAAQSKSKKIRTVPDSDPGSEDEDSPDQDGEDESNGEEADDDDRDEGEGDGAGEGSGEDDDEGEDEDEDNIPQGAQPAGGEGAEGARGSDGLSAKHRAPLPKASARNKDSAADVALFFGPKTTAVTTRGKVEGEFPGRWCNICVAENEGFISLANSTLRVHLRQHYDEYKRRCTDAGVKMHDHAMPRDVFHEREAAKKAGNKKQSVLDGHLTHQMGPTKFDKKNVLHAVTVHTVVDDQALALADKTTFRNCLVAMRPLTLPQELPNRYFVEKHINDKFIALIKKFRTEIEAAPGKVSTTTDGWSANMTSIPYLGVSAHWIDVKEDGTWILRGEIIGFRWISGRHTGENLAGYFMGACDRVGITSMESTKLGYMTGDNIASNDTLAYSLKVIHGVRNLTWDDEEGRLGCLGHVVHLGIEAIMGAVTKISVIENTNAIWEYDPSLAVNRVLEGKIDVIAALRTLLIKIQASGQRIERFQQLQRECGIATPLKVPLHSNVRWGTAFNMLHRAHLLKQPITLFVKTADDVYGPITTLRKDGRVEKKIDWLAFKFEDEDWQRVAELRDILQDANRIQHLFAAEKHPTIQTVLPALEELLSIWEKRSNDIQFATFQDAILQGIEKIKKYYCATDRKRVYLLGLVLHPFYKLHYIKRYWGGAEEQEEARAAGNSTAKDWVAEARQILADTVREYWKTRPLPATSEPADGAAEDDEDDNLGLGDDYDKVYRRLVQNKAASDAWKTELETYLNDVDPDVARMTDLVAWWSRNAKRYPTIARIALDILPVCASSVACERLFSAAREIATAKRSRLGVEMFEMLQLLKFGWRDSIYDFAEANKLLRETLTLDIRVFEELLAEDNETARFWD